MNSKTIVLCPNVSRDKGLVRTKKVKAVLEEAGHRVEVCPVCRTPAEQDKFSRSGYEPLECASRGAELLVALGGDGTILKVARAAVKSGVPIIGINLGHKGFMAELAPGDTELLLRAASGKFTPIKRMMLDVELIRDGDVIYSDIALNDAVVGAVANTIRVSAFGDGSKITEYSGDGIIVATPTGSTAYSLSAGGPLVEPTAENIILTPICAHLMTARPYVLASDRMVTVKTENNAGKKLWLSVDGGSPIYLSDGDAVRATKSRHTVIMAHVSNKSFYDLAFEKLGGWQ